MILSLSNLPHDVSLHDICELFPNDERIEHIHFSDDGNPDNVLAWIKFQEIGRVELNRMVDRFNGHFLQDRRLEAYAPLFFS